MSKIIDQAKAFCIKEKERLTRPRMEVLKILSRSKKPMGAYEILDELGKVLRSPKPPTVYRAIDFWHQNGFIHRIESLNAFRICSEDHQHQGSQFMICAECGNTLEAHICKLPKALEALAEKMIFKPATWNLEIHGLCEHCQ